MSSSLNLVKECNTASRPEVAILFDLVYHQCQTQAAGLNVVKSKRGLEITYRSSAAFGLSYRRSSLSSHSLCT